jgi:cell division protease FtsH
VKYGQTDGEPFLGRTMGHERDYSEKVAAEIDGEVRGLIELAHDEAWEILVEYRDVLDAIVEELFEKETISQADMARICARVVKRPPMAPFSTNGRGAKRLTGATVGEAAAPATAGGQMQTTLGTTEWGNTGNGSAGGNSPDGAR